MSGIKVIIPVAFTDVTLPFLSEIVAGDTFTRADSLTTLGVTEIGGQTWTPATGGTDVWGINAGKAYLVSTTGSGTGTRRVTAIDAGVSDGIVSLDLEGTSTSPRTGGIAFRVVDGSNFWTLSTTNLIKYVAGAQTNVATFSSHLPPVSQRVVLSGNDIEVFLDDVSIGTYTDSSHATATKHGLRQSISAANDAGPFDVRFGTFKVQTAAS